MGLFDIFKKKPQQPVYKKSSYKSFPIQKYKHSAVDAESDVNEEFDYTESEILDNCLEDTKIYRNSFPTIRLSIVDNGEGYDILCHDIVIGKLDSSTANDLDSFIASHPDHEYLLEDEGGTYKMYDSDSEKIITGYDKYTAKFCVKYYE